MINYHIATCQTTPNIKSRSHDLVLVFENRWIECKTTE